MKVGTTKRLACGRGWRRTGRPASRGGVARFNGFSPSTTWGCPAPGPAGIAEGEAKAPPYGSPKQYSVPSYVPRYTLPLATVMPLKWFHWCICSPLDHSSFPVCASST